MEENNKYLCAAIELPTCCKSCANIRSTNALLDEGHMIWTDTFMCAWRVFIPRAKHSCKRRRVFIGELK